MKQTAFSTPLAATQAAADSACGKADSERLLTEDRLPISGRMLHYLRVQARWQTDVDHVHVRTLHDRVPVRRPVIETERC